MKGFNNLPTYSEKTRIEETAPKNEGGKSKPYSAHSSTARMTPPDTTTSGFSLSKHERSKKVDIHELPVAKNTQPPVLKSPPIRPKISTAAYPFHRISPAVSNTLPEKDIVIKSAPNPTKPPKMNWFSVLATPAGILIVMVIMVLVMGQSSLSSFIFMLPMSLISVIVAVVNYRSQKKEVTQSQDEINQKYLAYLNEVEAEISGVAEKQQAILNAANPSVDVCAVMNAHSVELWNRGINNRQFMAVRLGVGEAPLCISVKAPEKSYDRDIQLEEKAREIAKNSRQISNIPVSFDLKAHPSLGIVGERTYVITQAISLIVNATAMHSYEDLKLVVVYPQEESAVWEDARWLPHVFDESRQGRYIACAPADCKVLLNAAAKAIEERANSAFKSPWANKSVAPHYLVVIADMNYIKGSAISHFLTLNDPTLSVSSIFLAPDISSLPHNCQGIIETVGSHAEVYLASAHDKKIIYTPDYLGVDRFSEYCHTMAPIRIDGAKGSKEIPAFVSFLDAWKVSSPENLQIADFWRKSLPSESMRVPLGAGAEGTMFYFDDHQNAHGVHGMYVGTNGSGKSSMIRSWILSMAVQFSPAYVNFVLVDFKGSGLLDGLEKLPHVVGTISNLDSDIRRNLTALESEIERRELFFKETGGNIYSCYKSGNTQMPFLYIIIDELNEFKLWSNAGDDNRMKLLDRLAQVGRALGIQLIAGSQTTAPFTDTMEKNARFRWCLKTATAEDSMYLLKTDDAFNITKKGRAIVRVGSNEVYEEVQPLFSDGPYYTPEELYQMPEREMALLSLQGTQTKVIIEDRPDKFTQLDAVVAQINKVASALHIKQPMKIWPDRLPPKVYLQELAKPNAGELAVAIGLVDDPKGQRQYTLQIDLRKNGHVVLYGAPRTGKTTFLLTAAISLLSHCNPDQVGVYMIGSSFKPLWNCPQVVKGVDSFAPQPVIAAVHAELTRRKKQGVSASDKPLILFVDGIGELMYDSKSELVNLAQFGAGCKIYLFASASKQADVSALSAYLTRGYALWFADSKYEYQSALAEKNVDRIPSKDITGRGVFYDGRTMEFQTAVPFRTNAELDGIVRQIIERNNGYKREPITVAKEIGDTVIGISAESNCEIVHNFRDKHSLLILGDDAGERERFLRTIAAQLAMQPDVFQIVGIDLNPSVYTSVKNMRFLHSGAEVDTYLQDMFAEVKRRNDLQNSGSNEQFQKYIFIINDWANCLSRISELSHKRLTVNVLQKGKNLGIQIITADTYVGYTERFNKDIIGATQLLGVGCAVLLRYSEQPLPVCYSAQSKQIGSQKGDYYVTSSSAELVGKLCKE